MLPVNPHPTPPVYGSQLCIQPQYHCVEVMKGDTWDNQWPNRREQDVLKRLNRINVALMYRPWVVVPNNLSTATTMSISPFPKTISPPGQKVIVMNQELQAYGAYNAAGILQYWGPGSPGKAWCPDIKKGCTTPVGVFRIRRKGTASCVSNEFPVQFKGSPMPYCMFFHGGAAIHGAELPSIPSTHGCFGVFNNDARWLNENFVKAGRKGTIVLSMK